MALVQHLRRDQRVLVDAARLRALDLLDDAGRLPNSEPSTRRPSFAIVAYARAMSSGLTATDPRPMEKYGARRLRMPRLWAVLTIAFGPTTSVSCA